MQINRLCLKCYGTLKHVMFTTLIQQINKSTDTFYSEDSLKLFTQESAYCGHIIWLVLHCNFHVQATINVFIIHLLSTYITITVFMKTKIEN